MPNLMAMVRPRIPRAIGSTVVIVEVISPAMLVNAVVIASCAVLVLANAVAVSPSAMTVITVMMISVFFMLSPLFLVRFV
jgi:hypothetical protein